MPDSANKNPEPPLKQRLKNPRIYALMLAAGLVIIAVLIAWEGLDKVGAALLLVGWNILWVAAFRFLPMAIDAAGWRHLFSGRQVPSFAKFVIYRWVAESCNTLLPAAQVGGHMVRAWMLARHAMCRTSAAASVVVDFTIGLGTQFLFVITGLFILLVITGQTLDTAFWALVLTSIPLMFGGFVLVQYWGLSGVINQIARRLLKNGPSLQFLGGLRKLEEETKGFYSNYPRLISCALLRLLGWASKSGETYLSLYFLGVQPTIGDALVLEAVGIAANSFGFLLPGALGIREGGIIIIAGVLGLPADTALALALIKRVRELLVGLPGLAVLLFIERDIILNHYGLKP